MVVRKDWTLEEDMRIIDMRSRDISYSVIGRIFGVSRQVAYLRGRKIGASPGKPRKPRKHVTFTPRKELDLMKWRNLGRKNRGA